MVNDPYKTLGIKEQASQSEIRNAYRKLAKKYHPDLNPKNKEAERRFKEISEAYELVDSPEKRQIYSQSKLDDHPHRANDGTGPQYNYRYTDPNAFDEDFLNSIFGGSEARSGRPFRDPEEQYQLEVDLEEAARGTDRQIQLPSGKRLQIKIPARIMNGKKLRFKGQGARGQDVFVEILVKDSNTFKQNGRNVEIELPVTLAEAILGAEVEAPTLDGPVKLKVPSLSGNGTKLRIRGKGLGADGARGDEIVTLRVIFPKAIDSEFQEAVKSWAARQAQNPRS